MRRELIDLFQKKEIPYVIVYNKADLLEEIKELESEEIYVSALNGQGIYELKEKSAVPWRWTVRKCGLSEI